MGIEILEGLKEIKQHKRGKVKLKTLIFPEQYIRKKLRLSQSFFENTYK